MNATNAKKLRQADPPTSTNSTDADAEIQTPGVSLAREVRHTLCVLQCLKRVDVGYNVPIGYISIQYVVDQMFKHKADKEITRKNGYHRGENPTIQPLSHCTINSLTKGTIVLTTGEFFDVV